MKSGLFGLSLIAATFARNIVYPECFEEQVKLALNVDKLEPSVSPSGIKLVFVYKARDTSEENLDGEITKVVDAETRTAESTAGLATSTAGLTAAPTPATIVTNFQYGTTTSTIYTASSTPASTTFTSVEKLETTRRNPLATGGIKIFKPLAESIEIASITDGVVFTNTLFPTNGPKMRYTQPSLTTKFTVASAVQLADSLANKALTEVANTALETNDTLLSRSLELSLVEKHVIVVESSCELSSSLEPSSFSSEPSSIPFRSKPSSIPLSSGRYLNLTSALATSAPSSVLVAPHYSASSIASSLSCYSSSASTGSLSGYSSSATSAGSLSGYSSSASSIASSLSGYSSSAPSSSPESESSTSESSVALSASVTESSSESTIATSTQTSSAASPRLFRVFSSTSTANGFTGDLFKAISTNAVSGKFPKQSLPLAIPSGVTNSDKYQTNKFYVNLFLGDQTDMIWSYPYGMQYLKSTYYGWAVQHTIPSARVFGNVNSNNNNPSYFFNPINIKELILSATSFTSNLKMSVSNMKVMSALVKLGLATNYIEVPVVQGMGFVTSIYHGNLIPQINSGVGVKTLVKETSSNLLSNILKFRATLFSGTEYLIYVTFPSGTSTSGFTFSVSNSNTIKASKNINGLMIQIAVAPSSSQDKYYDQTAGTYVTESKIKAHGYGGTTAEYRFSYIKAGSSKSNLPIVFLLPHHVDLIDATTKNAATGITLSSTTKGTMSAYLASEIIMNESLNYNIQFLPWVQQMGTTAPFYTTNQLKLLALAANTELSVDIKTMVLSMNSNYYPGKALDKYASILSVVVVTMGDKHLPNSTLKILKDTFAVFTNNQQYYPLMYDTKFGGITSTASQGGDTGAEFGSAYYNDHHFHYGYFVHAAAIIGYVDKKYGGTWYKDQQFWVNALIRDVANPSPDDKQFPVFRMFDWFAGHSWASGLFAAGDGRNEESSSEDYNFAYGMKLWGKVSGNQRMESTGDLMLAVMKRSMNMYMYYTSSNSVEPSQILPNKVSGILFDNKIDYTTYFGAPNAHPEYVHGIHMLPITPASSLIRGSAYVKEEWQDQISTFISNVKDGWAGILRLNQALFDASSSYAFFSSSSWSSAYLDNGQSRTWSLAFSAGVSNALS